MLRRRSNAALAIALILLPPLEGGATAKAAPCPPTALVEGDGDLVVSVNDALVRRGVGLSAQANCPAVRARVLRADDGVKVPVEDGYGRRSDRVAHNVDGAATVIESWARVDFSAPLLAARPAPEWSQAAADDELPPSLHRVVEPPAVPRPLGVSVTAMTSVATDGSLWLGVDVAGCARLGPACAGVIARWSADTQASGASERMETRRLGFDLLLAVDVPFLLDGMAVTPGVGLGVGWLRTGSVRSLAPGENIDFDGGGPRANAHLGLSVPIGSDLSVDLALSGDLSLLAHTAAFEEEGTTLAGEPHAYLRAGIGLRLGAP